MAGRTELVHRENRAERGGGPLQVEPVEEPVVGPSGGRGEDRVECDLSSVGQADAGQTSVLGQDAGDGRLFEPDTAGPQSGGHLGIGGATPGGEEHQVVGPLPDELSLVRRHGRRAQHRDPAAAHLPAVAIRAVEHARTPVVPQAGDVRELVGLPGRDDESTSGRGRRVGELDGQDAGIPFVRSVTAPRIVDPAFPDHGHGPGPHRHVVLSELLAPPAEQLERVHPLVAEDSVHVRGEAVARFAGVDDEHAAAGPAEHERRRQARGPTADHDRVPVFWCLLIDVHGTS